MTSEVDRGKHLMSSRGSVLMEFIIVAPLYFLLLGGMFILGDAALNRIRLHIGDRCVTWAGGDRRFQRFEDCVQQLRDAIEPMFVYSIDAQNPEFRVAREVGDSSQFNSFCAFYMGAVNELILSIPSWAQGMRDMPEVMANDYDSEAVSTTEFDCDYYRSFSFHRLWLRGVDDAEPNADDAFCRSRLLSANDMVSRGVLENVLAERWIGSAAEPQINTPLRGSSQMAKQRILGDFGE